MFPLYDENRSQTLPVVTWSLIVVNSVVFWWELTQGFNPAFFYRFGEIPTLVLQGKQLFTVVTSLFLHGDFWHIFGNMLYLFIFGDNVEDRLGHGKFVLVYVFFGIVGGLTHSLVAVWFDPPSAFIPAIGASGAISGILGAYVVFFPRARIMSLVPSFYFVRLGRVPAVLFIGFWFVLQLFSSGSATTVAYMAHIGGFIIGVLVALAGRSKNRNRFTG